MEDRERTERLRQLAAQIPRWAQALGFAAAGIADPAALAQVAERLRAWLGAGYQGGMDWLAERPELRLNPERLVPGTQRIILVRLNYFPAATDAVGTLADPDRAYVSRYALGRDYHKVVRRRLAALARRIAAHWPEPVVARPFADSAPVLEKPLAEAAGLGWQGKHTLLIHPEEGSFFFLGALFVNLPLPLSEDRQADRCGRCSACLSICPTGAFPRPYVLDARRCISYLTIEHRGPIPLELRPAMGNRVFGCDDCQLICPWNRRAPASREADFQPRHGLSDRSLAELFLWSEREFEEKTQGSPIRRAGYERWLRNLAVGLGNARDRAAATAALRARRDQVSPLVREHVDWALARLAGTPPPSPRRLPVAPLADAPPPAGQGSGSPSRHLLPAAED
ncbi:MAG: epoxyqueuosine reductase [Porticoccaceae bacterium]|nr:MAG: epoxyqueuosine reductase [Porticoccaceae bacterium]